MVGERCLGAAVGDVKVEVVGGGVFLVMDGVASGVGKVRVRLEIVLRLAAARSEDYGYRWTGVRIVWVYCVGRIFVGGMVCWCVWGCALDGRGALYKG